MAGAIVFMAAVLVVAVILVARSLRRPELLTFAPTPSTLPRANTGGRPDTTGRAASTVFTIDAESGEEWRWFDFSSGTLAASPPLDPLGWDIAVRRFHVIANGGPGFAGAGGIVNLGAVPFDSVAEAPDTGYVETRAGRDTVNAAIDRWYTYSWISHLLEPKGNVYIVRTADGGYAKMRILSYYCPGAIAGCLTFEFTYSAPPDRSFEAAR